VPSRTAASCSRLHNRLPVRQKSCPSNSSLSRFESTHSSKPLQSWLCPNGSGGGAVVNNGPRRRLHRAHSPAAEHHAARSALHRHNARAAWPATTPPDSARRKGVPPRASQLGPSHELPRGAAWPGVARRVVLESCSSRSSRARVVLGGVRGRRPCRELRTRGPCRTHHAGSQFGRRRPTYQRPTGAMPRCGRPSRPTAGAPPRASFQQSKHVSRTASPTASLRPHLSRTMAPPAGARSGGVFPAGAGAILSFDGSFTDHRAARGRGLQRWVRWR